MNIKFDILQADLTITRREGSCKNQSKEMAKTSKKREVESI